MKKIVFVTGDKGGVGKSFTSRLLVDWYMDQGKNVLAFDTDKTNSTLFRFFENLEHENFKIEQLDTDDQEVLDSLLNRIVSDETQDLFLVDCAARTLEQLLKWMSDIGFFEIAEEHGIKVTLAFVLGPEKDCVSILADISEDAQYGSKVEYVLIKNLGRGSQFKIYDESNVRKRLLNGSAVELSIPALISSTSLELDQKNLPFQVAKDSTALGVAERSRVRIFQKRAFEELGKAEQLWI